MNRRLLIAAGVIVVLGAGGFYLIRHRSTSSESYRLATVSRGNIASTVNATGTLSAVQTVAVGTQVSGQIAALHADFNDHVKKGQLIANLDPTVLEQQVQQAQADLTKAQADLQNKAFLYKQDDTLYKQRIVTETEYETALYNWQESQASLVSAQAALAKAKKDLSYTSIYAPISGVVIERNVQVGQTVAASLQAPQLFLLAEDLSRMQILASVDESDIGQIKEGQGVHFTVEAYPNRQFSGTVDQVRMQSTTTENVVNYTVVIGVSNPDGALLPGMTATVSFEIASSQNVLRVPNAALRLRATPAMLASAGISAGGRGGRSGDSTAASSDSSPFGRRRGDSTSAAARGGRGGGGGAVATTGAGLERTGQARSYTSLGFGQLWYVDDKGHPKMTRVHTGLSDGQFTEVSGAGLHEGMQVIVAVTSGAAEPTGVASPFQNPQQNGRGGRGGRGGVL